MIQKTFNVTVYEPGDVLDISAVVSKYSAKRLLNNSEKGMVLRVNHLINGAISYVLLTESGKTTVLKYDEQGNEKYIGRIDMSMLFGTGDNK